MQKHLGRCITKAFYGQLFMLFTVTLLIEIAMKGESSCYCLYHQTMWLPESEGLDNERMEIAACCCRHHFMSTVFSLSSLCHHTHMMYSLGNVEWLKRISDCYVEYVSRPCSKCRWKILPALILLSLLHLCSFLQLALSTSRA